MFENFEDNDNLPVIDILLLLLINLTGFSNALIFIFQKRRYNQSQSFARHNSEISLSGTIVQNDTSVELI